MRFLTAILLSGVLFFMPTKTNFKTINQCFSNSCSIKLYQNNLIQTFQKNSNFFNQILNEFEKTTQNSYQMPALGVSIHNLTIQQQKQGTWLEFMFETTIFNCEMPFDAILIKIEPDSYGLNLIRKFQGKYEGRCFYLNLENSTTNLYDFLINFKCSQ